MSFSKLLQSFHWFLNGFISIHIKHHLLPIYIYFAIPIPTNATQNYFLIVINRPYFSRWITNLPAFDRLTNDRPDENRFCFLPGWASPMNVFFPPKVVELNEVKTKFILPQNRNHYFRFFEVWVGCMSMALLINSVSSGWKRNGATIHSARYWIFNVIVRWDLRDTWWI